MTPVVARGWRFAKAAFLDYDAAEMARVRSMGGWLAVAAINGFLAVAAGAFATHGLAGKLDPHMLATFETGARYHMYHALALGLTAVAMRGPAAAAAHGAAWAFLAGILLFCGSLYGFALSGAHPLVFVTPIGGVFFLIGWALLAWAGMRLGA